MLRFSKKSDYGLIALKHIASQGEDNVVNAREISEKYNLPPDLLAKILQSLSKSGIIKSQFGSGGGYRMAKKPSEVTLKEIVQSIDGPVHLVGCSREDTDCSIEPQCTIKQMLLNVEQKLEAFFSTITLKDI
ncbi:MAG: Rrf2 family transcriptional regulator [Candidatus Latescibacteria bacterium]|nr:Rrf2 family transcriptional regulator [Candidatus Latescibacterota bacterium]NIO28360.1 Rrf2 family transcriptional regulator [Candidatus Latescibacterota bacterium]NIO55909.1 Rrf2 family transcriptional regulator [Candidatus Latescibacterota bacterium]NIT01873.1 Rrf2 family transcriptional regulator [Candidatus Latescibacterota bacterium]